MQGDQPPWTLPGTLTFPYAVLKDRRICCRCLLERLPRQSMMACSSVPGGRRGGSGQGWGSWDALQLETP